MALEYDFQFIGDRLTNSTAVFDIAGTRIYHGAIPETESTYPNVSYFMVSDPTMVFGHAKRPRFQISCRAESAGSAMTLAKTVQSAFVGFQGSNSTGGFDVQETYLEDANMIIESDNIHNVAVDIFLMYINT